MNQHQATHQGVAVGAPGGLAVSGTAWLTPGQVALRSVQLALFAGILLGSRDAATFLARDHRGLNLLVAALVLTALVLGTHVLACMVLNRLVPPGDAARRTRRRVLSWALEVALFPMSYLPLLLVLFIGPPVLRVLGALTQP